MTTISIYLDKTPFRIRSNKKIILKLVENDGLNLEYASNELKADKEVVMTAIKNNPRSFRAVRILNAELRHKKITFACSLKNTKFYIIDFLKCIIMVDILNPIRCYLIYYLD